MDLEIDPSATTPVTVVGDATQLAQISNAVGTGTDIPNFHDVRLDSAANKLYYSAIVVDKGTGATAGRTHMGWIDLATATKGTVHDASINATDAAKAGIVYCGSGQTADYFIPQTMSYPAYIDAVKKSAVTSSAAIE